MEKQTLSVIFDMDGTMVDSVPYHKKAWKDFLKLYDCDLSAKDLSITVSGKSNSEVLRYFLGEKITDKDIIKYETEKEDIFYNNYGNLLKPVNGLKDLLNSLRENNFQLAVATCAPTRNVNFMLNNFEITDFFSVIVDKSQVKNGKPDPEIYFKTLEKLNTKPENCIVFEDSPAGIEAAQNAGLNVIGVSTNLNLTELEKISNLAIPDFSGLNAETVTSLIKNHYKRTKNETLLDRQKF